MEGFDIDLQYTANSRLAEELGISVERHVEMGEKLVELSDRARLLGKSVGWILKELIEECEDANEVLWFAHSSFSFFNKMSSIGFNDDNDVQDS